MFTPHFFSHSYHFMFQQTKWTTMGNFIEQMNHQQTEDKEVDSGRGCLKLNFDDIEESFDYFPFDDILLRTIIRKCSIMIVENVFKKLKRNKCSDIHQIQLLHLQYFAFFSTNFLIILQAHKERKKSKWSVFIATCLYAEWNHTLICFLSLSLGFNWVLLHKRHVKQRFKILSVKRQNNYMKIENDCYWHVVARFRIYLCVRIILTKIFLWTVSVTVRSHIDLFDKHWSHTDISNTHWRHWYIQAAHIERVS